ncbi:HAD-IC family P-type ATPase [bacterium]|nr:HAD-IC family P-type ATPase [bacterium]
MDNYFQQNWHSIEKEEVLKILRTDSEKGLSLSEAESRKKIFGLNILPQKEKLTAVKILFSQLKNPLIYILIIAGGVALFLQEYTDAIVILLAAGVNTIIGYLQEYKANKTFEKLQKTISFNAKVLREGKTLFLDIKELVPGDIILIQEGDRVPADARIIEEDDLTVNESMLTGESMPQEKNEAVVSSNTPLGDRENMIYMGTTVESGRAKAVVVATGKDTQMGKISDVLQQIKEEKTPLQRKISQLSKRLAVFLTIIVFLVFLWGIFVGYDVKEMFIISVALAVASIPEGLPIALTVTLAIGMQRILKHKGLVRQMVAAETLGSASVICTDKTGTLTYGEMRVEKIYVYKNQKRKEDLLLKTITFCNTAFFEERKWKERKVVGNMTERALLEYSFQEGYLKEDLLKSEPQIKFSSFNSKDKFSFSIHKNFSDNILVYCLGAPEILLEKSRSQKKEREAIKRKINDLTNEGFRVLGAGFKSLSGKNTLESSTHQKIIEGVDFLGLIALRDPLREDAKETIQKVKSAGIKPIIVTGDHKLTAKRIAQKVGIKVEDKNILEGKDIDKLDEKEFSQKISEISVYARVAPEHKIKIIKAWQAKNEVVAMTGDGVNDVLALKKADIGIALGSGTDIAKESADLILLDNSFKIILEAIEEGRVIIDNIRKVVTYLFSDLFSEIILIGASILFKLPLPLLPAQILWINLIEDSLPNFALALEPKEKDVLKRKPEKKEKPLLTLEMKWIIFFVGLITDFLLLGLFLWLYYHRLPMSHIRTIIFAGLGMDSLFFVYSCKNLHKNIWRVNIFSNKYLVLSSFFRLGAILTAIYLPLFQKLLKLSPLSYFEWFYVIMIGILNLLLIELVKLIFIKEKKIYD